MAKRFVVVLADGETWTELEGCKVFEVTHEDVEHLCPTNAKDFTPKSVWSLNVNPDFECPVLTYNPKEQPK